MEILKELHIPFRTKVKVQGQEVDFLIGKYAIELDGHAQDSSKNRMLLHEGYIPIHLNNDEVTDDLRDWVLKLYGRNIIRSSTSNNS